MLSAMQGFRRQQVQTLVERMEETPQRLIAVFGPRQTGKTTAALQALASTRLAGVRLAADEAETGPAGPLTTVADGPGPAPPGRDSRWLTRVWQESRAKAWIPEEGFVLVLDEIHKIDGWSDVVKGLWDADRISGCPLRVVLIGSAPLLMKAGMDESLAGRFETLRFEHWSYLEMAEAFGFSLDQYVYFGGCPGAAGLVSDPDRWVGYMRGALVEPSIDRDVLEMQRVDKPALLRQLFEYGSRCSAQILSYNKMLGHLQDAGNTTTLTRYLQLLSQAGLLTGLSNHTGSPVSARASTPKLNVLDTAFMSAVCGYTFEEARNDRSHWGRLVESAVGAHLVNTASVSTAVKYWRDRNNEVDFVLHRGPNLVGIEVKSGITSPRHRALTAFRQRFSPRSVITVGADVALDEFLSRPADYWIDAS